MKTLLKSKRRETFVFAMLRNTSQNLVSHGTDGALTAGFVQGKK